MNQQEIENVLVKIESCMKMTCDSCGMPEMLNPLIDKLKKMLDSETSSQAGK